ncbi:MAG: hypothetical protein N3B18_11605 [Desulfobacterota bacterium]|nr:hypothetical protein [Thermodesulfobacteriota bacterium]
MNITSIDIARNDMRKSLPEVAANEAQCSFLVVWAAAPGENSSSFDYTVSGRLISGSGQSIGNIFDIIRTSDILMLPRVLYNPHNNQYLVIYCRGENYFNIRGVFLDEAGNPVSPHFAVTDVPANQFHYTMAFNSKRNQFLIVYNDFRNDISTVYGLIIDERGRLVRPEFPISNAPGHQINPVVCYNPDNDTYLINWEDFRAHGNGLEPLGTLEVMTDIYGALLSGDGTVIINDIPMCADAAGANADQRFNGIVYNPRRGEFLASWTDTSARLHNVGIMGRIVLPDGSMPESDFPLVDGPGAQMIGHVIYVPQKDGYFIAFERDHNDVDKFYFKDIKAKLSIAAQWLDGNGKPIGDMLDIFSGSTNQRFVRVAYNQKSNSFLIVWQSDFPGVSDSVEGHIMSAGGDIRGALLS